MTESWLVPILIAGGTLVAVELTLQAQRSGRRREEQLRAAAVTSGTAAPAEGSAFVKWGLPLVVGVLGLAGTIGSAAINRPQPDCLAYVDSLLKVRAAAHDNNAATAAVGAMSWGKFENRCGEAELFMEPLGELPPK